MSDILEAKNLTKSFKPHFWSKPQVRLNDFSFCLPEGSTTALLGHNGAGKTTTIRIILGIIGSENGQILFRGKKMKDEDKRELGYMPENNKLAYNLTPVEILNAQLATLGIPKNERFDRINNCLNTVGLYRHRHKQVKSMSKGMGRRLAWAQATIHNPSLVILDEPFSGLDPLGRSELENWIHDLTKGGASLLMSTHELQAAQRTCERFYLIRSGKLVSFKDDLKNGEWMNRSEIEILFDPNSSLKPENF